MRRPRMVTHRSGLGLELEIWSFSGAWSLGLGLWCAFGLRDFQNQICARHLRRPSAAKKHFHLVGARLDSVRTAATTNYQQIENCDE